MTHETDAVVIGAGPVGLFQVFQLGLQGIRAHIIDTLPHPGGQCVELYGDKPIYDIPGIPVCTGRELAEQLLRQIEPFGATWHLSSLVSGVSAQADGRWRVEMQTGISLLTRVLFIAAGVGAFVPRTLKIEGMDRFVGTQVHYQQLPPQHPVAHQHVVVHGGEDAAVRCAVALALRQDAPASITLLHRRDVFQAPAPLLEDLQALRTAGRIRVETAQITALETSGEQLSGLRILDAGGTSRSLPTVLLIAALGISPRLGPIAEWGLAMERKQLVVDTAHFRTSEPTIHAVGDINTYPGKRKLILCGFHEATLAAFSAAETLRGQPAALQYTTTSSVLHQRLGLVHRTPV